MAKRAKLSADATLPCEVILTIAQFLPDEASFFALLEACQDTTSDLGPFKTMWRLGHTIRHSNLWSSLTLYPMLAHEWKLAIQAIPFYETVVMHAWDDLHRLVNRVQPLTNLVVMHSGKPNLKKMHEWFDQLAQLPVRGLDVTTTKIAGQMPRVIPHLVSAWPTLTYLRRLDLTVGNQDSLESICKCIASSQSTKLRLEGQKRLDGFEVPHVKLEDLAFPWCTYEF